jgi:cytochrome c556
MRSAPLMLRVRDLPAAAAGRWRAAGMTGLCAALLAVAAPVPAADPPAMHHRHAHHAGMHQPVQDTRQPVKFPAPMREHTLASMRDHLAALTQIQQELAAGRFDDAAETAERRLGMSALPAHGAHQSARLMPAGMREAGSAMHGAASRFAVAARDASVTGRLDKAVGALAEIGAACVACHAAYRFE